jgi:NAD-dependent dihydropyrimidine dehydrogenase PreA subunit
MYNVAIDKNKCNGCGECVDICPADVLEVVNEKSEPKNMEECLGCESCVETCPEGAITVAEI